MRCGLMIMRNIMITGASSDIGLACVNLSLSEGHIVHAFYRRNSDELNSLKELLIATNE